MPEVVNVFLKTNNYQDAYTTQKKIMESYHEDIKHYASTQIRQKISDCYRSIPRQLAKEYTKFQYKVVSKEGNARRYDKSLNWLVDAGMIKMCINVSAPQFPLVAYEKPDQFKVYVTDIGLLTSLYGYETQVALLKNTLIFIVDYNPPCAYKLISGNLGISDTKVTLPLYMTMFI